MSAKKGNIKIANYTDWMSQLPSELWTIPLFKLAIPGKCIQCNCVQHQTQHVQCVKSDHFVNRNTFLQSTLQIFWGTSNSI